MLTETRAFPGLQRRPWFHWAARAAADPPALECHGRPITTLGGTLTWNGRRPPLKARPRPRAYH